jgi:hypothetical protein
MCTHIRYEHDGQKLTTDDEQRGSNSIQQVFGGDLVSRGGKGKVNAMVM